EDGRHAGAGTDQVRARHQHQDRQRARSRRAAAAARPRRRGDRVRRREFITLLGGAAAAWPLAARAQQPQLPVIGCVNSGTAGANVKNIAAFRAGLAEAGFVEGQNVAIEFRWAENQFDRLPALVTGLINRPADVIVVNTPAVLRAKAATAT